MGDKVTEAEKAPVKEAIEKLKTAQKTTASSTRTTKRSRTTNS